MYVAMIKIYWITGRKSNETERANRIILNDKKEEKKESESNER